MVDQLNLPCPARLVTILSALFYSQLISYAIHGLAELKAFKMSLRFLDTACKPSAVSHW
jgi:hypothetical protein